MILWVIAGIAAWFAVGYLSVRWALILEPTDAEVLSAGSILIYFLISPVTFIVVVAFAVVVFLEKRSSNLSHGQKVRKFFHIKGD